MISRLVSLVGMGDKIRTKSVTFLFEEVEERVARFLRGPLYRRRHHCKSVNCGQCSQTLYDPMKMLQGLRNLWSLGRKIKSAGKMTGLFIGPRN